MTDLINLGEIQFPRSQEEADKVILQIQAVTRQMHRLAFPARSYAIPLLPTEIPSSKDAFHKDFSSIANSKLLDFQEHGNFLGYSAPQLAALEVKTTPLSQRTLADPGSIPRLIIYVYSWSLLTVTALSTISRKPSFTQQLRKSSIPAAMELLQEVGLTRVPAKPLWTPPAPTEENPNGRA